MSDTPVPQLREPRKIDKLQAWKLRVHSKLTYQEIATLMHCSRQSVQQACERLSRLIPDPEQAKAYHEVRPDVLNAVEEQLLHSLTCPDKIAKANLNNVAYALTQVSTLRRLESGQSTANINTISRLIGTSDDKLFNKTPPPVVGSATDVEATYVTPEKQTHESSRT